MLTRSARHEPTLLQRRGAVGRNHSETEPSIVVHCGVGEPIALVFDRFFVTKNIMEERPDDRACCDHRIGPQRILHR